MGALIAISDLETALGRTFEDDEEEAKWQRYINSLSDYINSRVDVAFEIITDGVARLQANYEGEIFLKGPVSKVTSVKDFRTHQEDPYVDWDGISTLFNLWPDQVVDVTWSYGLAGVPDDIKNVMITGVLAALDEGSPIDLRSYKVGDVQEDMRQGSITQLFGFGINDVLTKYGTMHFTMNTASGGHYYDYHARGFTTDA